MYTKNDFINAYIYCYGTTKSKANKVYRENKDNKEYINAICESLKNDCKKMFYND